MLSNHLLEYRVSSFNILSVLRWKRQFYSSDKSYSFPLFSEFDTRLCLRFEAKIVTFWSVFQVTFAWSLWAFCFLRDWNRIIPSWLDVVLHGSCAKVKRRKSRYRLLPTWRWGNNFQNRDCLADVLWIRIT